MPWNGKEVWVYPKHLLDKPVDINEMKKKSPEEAEGMQISFRESLEGQIFNLQGKEDLKGDIIKLKISGDSTCIGKRLKLVNITYSIINKKRKCSEWKGQLCPCYI